VILLSVSAMVNRRGREGSHALCDLLDESRAPPTPQDPYPYDWLSAISYQLSALGCVGVMG